jgi:putative tryptophan/tyrosine transport system substrate-binding protein
MRRREFIAGLGGVAAWPVVGHAQQSKVPVVGYVHAVSPEDQEANLAAFRKALAGRGFVEGRNVAVEYRYAHNDYNRLPELDDRFHESCHKRGIHLGFRPPI